MDEYFLNWKEKVTTFFREYGKVCVSLVGIVSLFFLVVSLFLQGSSGTFKVMFFDVGQGDSILIETPSGHTMLIDGGGNATVLKKLDRELGLRKRDIDVVVETHADADHVTGLIPVLMKYSVATLVMSPVSGKTDIFKTLSSEIEKEKEEGAHVYTAQGGDSIDFGDGVHVTVLYPYGGYEDKGDTNDASVSLLVTYEGKSFLLTGDLPIGKEGYLITSGYLPHDVTVYKAGHHGSKNSSGNQLLSYIQPTYAVISAGKDNKYGHPNSETLERLGKYTKEIVSTIGSGDISFSIKNEHLLFETSK